MSPHLHRRLTALAIFFAMLVAGVSPAATLFRCPRMGGRVSPRACCKKKPSTDTTRMREECCERIAPAVAVEHSATTLDDSTLREAFPAAGSVARVPCPNARLIPYDRSSSSPPGDALRRYSSVMRV